MRVLLGIHTAGKSTLGHMFQNKGFPFFPEVAIGFLNNQYPWLLDDHFDVQVMANEFKRDQLFYGLHDPFFVETWHIGNMAYARARNSKVIDKYYYQIRQHVEYFSPTVYLLAIPPEIISVRSKYFSDSDNIKQVIDFYRKVTVELYSVIELLKITPVIIDATSNAESVFNKVLSKEISLPVLIH
jgi:hypothetical protein